MDYTNLFSVTGGAIITGFFTYVVTRSAKHHDAKMFAEAALLQSGPAIIAEQNKRIAILQKSMDDLWERLQQTGAREEECRDELRELRHQNHDLQTKIIILDDRLAKLEGKKDVR